MSDKKRVLITGGAGFIGSHLSAALLARGDEVFCLDNFFSGSASNITGLRSHPRFTLLEQDVVSPLQVDVHEIYNLACPASPARYRQDAIQTIRTNVQGAMNVLELAKSTGAKVLQASTSEVYGSPSLHPQPETYWGYVNPIGERSCYNESKRCAETLCCEYRRQHAVDVKIVRIFNTYGPGMQPDDGRVVSNFIVQALNGEELTVYGTGSQTRSFCFITDLVEGLIRMMETEKEFMGPVNLGNPGEFTILELAGKILQLTRSKSAISFKSLPQDDPEIRRPDVSLAKTELNWEPTVSLTEGLERTIAYFLDRKEGSRGLKRENSQNA